MQVERSIEKTAASTTGTVLIEGFLCLVDDTLVARQTCIGIRAEHQHVMATHLNFCSLLTGYFTKIGVNIQSHELLRFTIALVSFL